MNPSKAFGELKIYNDFVEQEDIIKAINMIEKLYTETDLVYYENIEGHHRFSYPKGEDAEYLVIKYGRKIAETLGREDAYPHAVDVLKYTEGGWMGLHTDKLNVGCEDCHTNGVIYFNDDYEGGEICFPNLPNPVQTEFKEPPGSAVVYPISGEEYMHSVNSITGGFKYVLVFCFTTRPDAMDPDYKKAYFG